jgi:hypothetical protein
MREDSPVRPSLPVVYEKFYADDTPALGDAPRARGTILVAFREAVVGLWGAKGLSAVSARLSAAVRNDTLDGVVVSSEWVPEGHVIAWYDALWSGPCERRTDLFNLVIDRMLDLGFGRVRRVFLSMASPATIFTRAPSLWRYDHTHGQLTVEAGPAVARLCLSNHPYIDSPLSCLAVAEVYRYCTALTRVKSVTATHFREPDGSLIVRLRYTS